MLNILLFIYVIIYLPFRFISNSEDYFYVRDYILFSAGTIHKINMNFNENLKFIEI